MLPINSKVTRKGEINRWHCVLAIQERGKVGWENECLLIKRIELILKWISIVQFGGVARIEQPELINKSAKIRNGGARTLRLQRI